MQNSQPQTTTVFNCEESEDDHDDDDETYMPKSDDEHEASGDDSDTDVESEIIDGEPTDKNKGGNLWRFNITENNNNTAH